MLQSILNKVEILEGFPQNGDNNKTIFSQGLEETKVCSMWLTVNHMIPKDPDDPKCPIYDPTGLKVMRCS